MLVRVLYIFLAAAPLWAGYKATIHRDEYGVPHIYGRTDADTVFGLAYAMAEDNFWQLEEDYIRRLGRAAQLHGREGLDGDVAFRLFEVEKRARGLYADAPAALRAICDAFAAGYNHYLHQHPATRPRLLGRLEGWEVLAFQDASPGLLGAGVNRGDVLREFPELASRPEPAASREDDEGSNMWAVAPKKSASGKAMLFLNPHVGFFGGGQRFEAHLDSSQGLRVSGFAILGTPYIRSGFTSWHGWCHTNNNADIVDVWKEPENPKDIETWTETIPMRGGESVVVRLRKTHHGPIVGMRDGRPLAKNNAIATPLDLMTQRIGMGKARTLAEFKSVMQRRAMTGSNTMYADREGNIYYLHGNAIPRRNPVFDWTAPVDGSLAETEWQGLHPFDDLVQFTNPQSGFLQNCNSLPLYAAGKVETTAEYPKYFLPEPDNYRSQRSREILTGRERFSFEDWSKAALDTGVFLAGAEKSVLAAQWPAFVEKFPERAGKLKDAVALIQAWDGVSRIDSVPMSLFMTAYLARTGDNGFLTPENLETGVQQLERDHGSWRIPWGELNRMQRIHTSGRLETFADSKPSFPVPGAPGPVGIVFNFYAAQPPGQKRLYGRTGNSYIAVVEFGKKIRAGSLLVFGQSADPQSPHFLDQAPLYSGQKFKPVHYYSGDVRKHAKSKVTVESK